MKKIMLGLFALVALVVSSMSFATEQKAEFRVFNVNKNDRIEIKAVFAGNPKHWNETIAGGESAHHASDSRLEKLDAWVITPHGKVKAKGLNYGFANGRAHSETFFVFEKNKVYHVERGTKE